MTETVQSAELERDEKERQRGGCFVTGVHLLTCPGRLTQEQEKYGVVSPQWHRCPTVVNKKKVHADTFASV